MYIKDLVSHILMRIINKLSINGRIIEMGVVIGCIEGTSQLGTVGTDYVDNVTSNILAEVSDKRQSHSCSKN